MFNFSIPLLFCVFSYLWKEIFHEYLWKSCGNFPCVFFAPYKVNIPMYAGGFKQVQYKAYICWMQVKIYISDQTSLRICNSVASKKRSFRKKKNLTIFVLITGRVWSKFQKIRTRRTKFRLKQADKVHTVTVSARKKESLVRGKPHRPESRTRVRQPRELTVPQLTAQHLRYSTNLTASVHKASATA